MLQENHLNQLEELLDLQVVHIGAGRPKKPLCGAQSDICSLEESSLPLCEDCMSVWSGKTPGAIRELLNVYDVVMKEK